MSGWVVGCGGERGVQVSLDVLIFEVGIKQKQQKEKLYRCRYYNYKLNFTIQPHLEITPLHLLHII